MKVGTRVVIAKGNPWEGQIGTYVGDEKTLIGTLHKIELDNGFGVLLAYTRLREIDIAKGAEV